MQIKAQGLLHAAKYIEERFGRDNLGLVVRACSQGVGDSFVASNAILWHPAMELVEFVETADRMLSDGTGRIAQDVGVAGARANTGRSLQRAALLWTKTDFIMPRVASMWKQFNDEGAMLFNGVVDRSLQIEVTGVSRPHATLCRILTGWCSEIGEAVTAAHVAVEHTSCRAKGDRRCLWMIRTPAVSKLVPSSA